MLTHNIKNSMYKRSHLYNLGINASAVAWVKL